MIFSKEFRDELIDNPFSRSNRFNYLQQRNTEFFIFPATKKVPLIAIGNEVIKTNEVISYSDAIQFNTRLLSKAKIQEIMAYSPILLKVKYGNDLYLAGKGMLCGYTEADSKITPLFVALVPNRLDWFDTDMIMVISKTLNQPENRIVNNLIQDFVVDSKGDVFYTHDVEKFIGQDIPIPKFTAMSQKKAFATNLINSAFDTLKAELA